jgi:hypothetical protein
MNRFRNVFDVTGKHVLGENVDHLFFAAKDFYTTSATICYFLYHLGRDKKLQTRIRQEIRARNGILGNLGNVTVEEFQEKLPILSAAIYETIRLAPTPRKWSSAQDKRLAGLEIDGQQIPKDTHIIMFSLEASFELPSVWGEDSADFRLERFLISSDSGPQIDLKAIGRLFNESFLPFESNLDKLFAYQQLMIGSLLLLNAFEFTDTVEIVRADEFNFDKRTQSWLEIAMTTSLAVSHAKE